MRYTLILLLLLAGCAAPAGPGVDLTLAADGCAPASLTLPATREPLLTLRNGAAEAMVVSVPTMDIALELAPGAAGELELPRYIMGSFDLFCLTADDHRALGGDNPFLCAFEPAELAPVARSAGHLLIEPHDRIREVLP